MADKSKIEWTDATWNPVRGCSRVSEGCRNCYAEHQALRITRFDRAKGVPEGHGAYDGLVTLTSQGPKWTGQIRELMDKLDEPIRWKKPRRIFVNSMSDLFHDGVSDVFIADVFAAMACAPQHTFQVLTKRPQRMQQLLTSDLFAELFEQSLALVCDDEPTLPQRHIQLGVSVEDQAAADARIPLLLQTPAAVRFLSVEPLLGPVDLPGLVYYGTESSGGIQPLREKGYSQIDWVIVGGESGHGARLMKAEWAQSLRDQCQAAGVPFFFKQWGGADKKAAGRLLDGVEHNGFPEVP
jgi:protein gp37